jgi:cytochrome b subunit of formate dehydrogenase
MSKNDDKKSSQLKLSLKESFLGGIAGYKNRFELFRAKWDIKKYTKSNWVWFTLIISISFLVTQIYTIVENFPLLPTRIPIFPIYIDANDTLAKKDFTYLLPGISLILIITGIIFSNRYYNKERNLSNTLLWTMLLSVTVITLALIRLISLY